MAGSKFDFRIDGALHAANCYANGYRVAGKGVFTLSPQPCLQKLIDAKANGQHPTISFDRATQKIHVQINGVPIVRSFGLDLDRDQCAEIRRHVRTEL